MKAVAPGTIRTRARDAQGGPDHLAGKYPLRRIGEPADVAAAIIFLCSSDADWVTGHTLPVDGGLQVPGRSDAPTSYRRDRRLPLTTRSRGSVSDRLGR